jgi:SAM-dependent MidA family methyltransferase
LLAYHRHATNEDYLARVGEQDLTAHVDFTALAEEARRLGWTVAGCTTQDRFLIAGGLIDDLDELAAADDPTPAAVTRRLAGTRLLQPSMGRGFRVLTLCRGVAMEPPLLAQKDPLAPRRPTS